MKGPIDYNPNGQNPFRGLRMCACGRTKLIAMHEPSSGGTRFACVSQTCKWF